MPKHPIIHLICLLILFPTQTFPTDVDKEQPRAFKIVTYNILNNDDLASDRGKMVLDVLAQSKADLILLQEVNLSFLEKIKEEYRFTEYHLHYHQQQANISGGLVILSRYPVKATQRYEALPSGMRRGILYLMFEQKGQFLCVTNIHLDSMMDDTSIRIEQLKSIFHHLRYCDDIILAGDFNFAEGEPEEVILEKNYQDSWQQLQPNKKGLTYDRENNELSDNNAFWLEPSRRLDRIYFNNSCLSTKSIRLIGKQGNEQSQKPPSDHYGLQASIQIRNECAK